MDTNTLEEILTGYKEILGIRYPRNLKEFILREVTAAKFEAACFSIFRSYGLEVVIGENLKKRGPDFLCSCKMGQFALEVTIINTTSMEDKTGMKNCQKGILGGFYQAYQTDPALRQKLVEKAGQVSACHFPRIVAIGSFHNESLTLFREVLADEYLDVFLDSDSHGNLQPNVDLRDISAIVLIGFSGNDYTIMGILNPEPIYHFNIEILPDIAFRRITERGMKDKTGEGEWVKSKIEETGITFRYPLQAHMLIKDTIV